MIASSNPRRAGNPGTYSNSKPLCSGAHRSQTGVTKAPHTASIAPPQPTISTKWSVTLSTGKRVDHLTRWHLLRIGRLPHIDWTYIKERTVTGFNRILASRTHRIASVTPGTWTLGILWRHKTKWWFYDHYFPVTQKARRGNRINRQRIAQFAGAASQAERARIRFLLNNCWLHNRRLA